ncbi:hypothetical protein LEMLEM_LOCUS220 [Lemmus lemmus]
MPAFSCSHWSMNSHSNPGLTGPYLQNAQRPVTELAGARRLAGGLCLQACTTTSDSCSAGDITWNLLHVSVASSPAAAEGIHHNSSPQPRSCQVNPNKYPLRSKNIPLAWCLAWNKH